VLIRCLNPNEWCKALYEAFGVCYTKTQELLQPSTATEVAKHTKNFTRSMLMIKQPEELLIINVVTMCRYNHTYTSSTINQPTFPKKPTIGGSPAEHYIMPLTSELK
jgi:hypothetical protein